MEHPDDIGQGGFNGPQGLERLRNSHQACETWPKKEGGCWQRSEKKKEYLREKKQAGRPLSETKPSPGPGQLEG
jgi:hypothetical protein